MKINEFRSLYFEDVEEIKNDSVKFQFINYFGHVNCGYFLLKSVEEVISLLEYDDDYTDEERLEIVTNLSKIDKLLGAVVYDDYHYVVLYDHFHNKRKALWDFPLECLLQEI